MTDWTELKRQGKFAEAEPVMLAETENAAHGYEILTRAGFYEDWGDAAENEKEALEHYARALEGFQIFASWATGSGEGLARMIDVGRVKKKIAVLKEGSS